MNYFSVKKASVRLPMLRACPLAPDKSSSSGCGNLLQVPRTEDASEHQQSGGDGGQQTGRSQPTAAPGASGAGRARVTPVQCVPLGTVPRLRSSRV